jgi:hypothetical protein
MDEKEVKEIVTKAMEGKMSNVEGIIAKAFKDIITPVEERLVALEKGTNGSGQDESGDLTNEDVEKAELEAAARIVKSVRGE